MLWVGMELLPVGGAEVVDCDSICVVEEGLRVSGSKVSGGTSNAGGGILG